MFWRATFYELTAALSARLDHHPAPKGMSAKRLEELMKAYPDGR